MEDHNNEKRPRQQGRSNYTRRAPRANNNNQNRKPGAPAPAASAPQAAAEKPQPQHRKPQRRRAPQPQQAAASNAVNAAAPAPVQRPRSPQRRSYKQHYYDASTPAIPMHICPLGGLGEVGKNITLYECQGDMILVDCGLVFPDSDMFGVDLVIPDFTYVLENKDRIKGLFITHGHEDHIGSLPYLLKKFNVPIYTARLTIGLIKNKLEEHGLASSAEFHEIRPRQKVRLGCFTVEPIHVNHSIPDSLAFAIDCPAGTVLHTGDFKIDYTPLSGDAVTDLSTIAEYGRRGVLALLADSTNAERPGFTKSERSVGDSFDALFRGCQQRIIVTTFASNVDRIQQIIDVAARYGRKVAVTGRSMENAMKVSTELGYMNIPDGVLVDLAPPGKGRMRPERLARLAALAEGRPLLAAESPAAPAAPAAPAPSAEAEGELEALYLGYGLEPPPWARVEPRFAGRIREARRACRRLKERGVLLELSPGHLLHAGAVRAAEARLRGRFGSASFSLAQARDALGCSRRCALLLLEHWDASGVTRRQGEGRIFSTSA